MILPNKHAKIAAMWLALQPFALWADASTGSVRPATWWKSAGVIYALQNAIAFPNNRACLEQATSSLVASILAANLPIHRVASDHAAVLKVQAGRSITLRKAQGDSMILYTVSLDEAAHQVVVHHPKSYEFAIADAPADLAETDLSHCFRL